MKKIPEHLRQQKLNHIWWSGFCHTVVEFSAATFDDPDGEARREAFVKEHINECTECACAFLWKNAEAELARRLGAFEFFRQGGDVFQRYGDRARKGLAQMLQETEYPKEMLEFLSCKSLRYGRPYPGRPGALKGTWKR